MSDETTLPPVNEPKWKRCARMAYAFARAHWDWCGPMVGFLIGYLCGKI